MAANEIHVGDVGTAFWVTITDDGTVVDVSDATVKQIIFTKPSGEKLTKNAAFVTDGIDGKISYMTVDGDLDESAQWKLQAHVVTAAGEWRSDIYRFHVHPNL